MTIHLHKNFEKEYRKLKTQEKKRVKERLALFLSDEFNPVLNNHPLRGRYKGYRSINITGDIRAVYKRVSDKTRIFVILGSHSKLYK